jgi:2'-5' RNA ligase
MVSAAKGGWRLTAKGNPAIRAKAAPRHKVGLSSFVSAEVTREVRARLAKVQEALQASRPDVVWVRPEHLHLTLRFLGRLEGSQLKRVQAALSEGLRAHRPVAVALQGVGAFPSLRSPWVIWVGVHDGSAGLRRIHEAVDLALRRLGFPKEERVFLPHLTLGRLRSGKNREGLVAALASANAKSLGQMVVNRVDLMQSEVRSSGPRYVVVKSFPLRPAMQ